jgi:hypothetical protein
MLFHCQFSLHAKLNITDSSRNLENSYVHDHFEDTEKYNIKVGLKDVGFEGVDCV